VNLSEFAKPVLAIDCALGGCAVAVLSKVKAASRTYETEREQAARLMPLIQEVISEAGIAFADLGLIATTIGPGSFTGLRIGLSAARTLGLALNIPVQGVTTFEAMARSAVPENAPCLVVLETKREDFYAQAFADDKTPLEEPACFGIDVLREKVAQGEMVVCGDALARLGVEGRSRTLIDPVILGRAGQEIFTKNGERAEKPVPLYLRGADVTMSQKPGRTIKEFTSP
jgi:tRNA threonylcarbamoyladenosine biosynthesis protein TsaB